MLATSTRRLAAGAAAAAAVAATTASLSSTTGAAPRETAGKLPKLTYFDGHGRAFAARVALRGGDVKFEDERMDYKGLMAARGAGGYNDRVPLGQLPTLTLPDGSVHVQSQSIARWAGRKSGWYPTNEDDALVVDEAMECMNEMGSKLPDDKDPEVKKQKRADYVANVIPRYLDHVSRLLHAKGGPFLLGKTISVGDLFVHRFVERVHNKEFDHIDASVLDKWPAVVACHKAVLANKAVQAEYASAAKPPKA